MEEATVDDAQHSKIEADSMDSVIPFDGANEPKTLDSRAHYTPDSEDSSEVIEISNTEVSRVEESQNYAGKSDVGSNPESSEQKHVITGDLTKNQESRERQKDSETGTVVSHTGRRKRCHNPSADEGSDVASRSTRRLRLSEEDALERKRLMSRLRQKRYRERHKIQNTVSKNEEESDVEVAIPRVRHALSPSEKLMVVRCNAYFKKLKKENDSFPKKAVGMHVSECLGIARSTVSTVLNEWGKNNDPFFTKEKAERVGKLRTSAEQYIEDIRELVIQRNKKELPTTSNFISDRLKDLSGGQTYANRTIRQMLSRNGFRYEVFKKSWYASKRPRGAKKDKKFSSDCGEELKQDEDKTDSGQEGGHVPHESMTQGSLSLPEDSKDQLHHLNQHHHHHHTHPPGSVII